MNRVAIREYDSTDCAYLAQLFYDTVHTVNAKDYTEEQLDAWADGKTDMKAWDESLKRHIAFVAEYGGEIAGFGDIDDRGYLDRLFVHRDYQGKGIATALCDRLESAVKTGKITTHASITAKSFFEKRGYKVIREQQVERRGILLTNYVMEKDMNRSGRKKPCG